MFSSMATARKIILQFRKYSTGRPNTFEEWKTPVPWGQISGKWWGDKKTVPVIAIHEFRQNAAAFDNLIPKLEVPSVLAIDLPGHGLSSHFPKGRNVTHMEFLVALRYLTLKLAPGRISFIGHGLGSYLAFVFSATYFKLVESLISIECGRHVFPVLTTSRPNAFGEVADRCYEIENSPQTSITEKELLRIMQNTGRMSNEAAKILSYRASQRLDEKLIFTQDPRYELFFFSSFMDHDLLTFANNVKCNFVEIRNKADDGLIKYAPGETERSAAFDSNLQQLVRRRGPEAVREIQQESTKRLRKSCYHFLEHEVNTTEHLLLDNAHEIAQIINDFNAMDFEEHRVIPRSW